MALGGVEGKYAVILWSVEEENIGDIISDLAKVLEIEQKKASTIVQTIPIVLVDKLSLEAATRVKTNLSGISRLGADIRIAEEGIEKLPKLSWPVRPRFVQLIEEVAKKRRLTNVFRCPSCGEVLGVQIVPTKRRQMAAQQPPPPVTLSPKEIPAPPTFSHLLTAGFSSPVSGYIPPPAASGFSVPALPAPSEMGAETISAAETAAVDRIFNQEIDLGDDALDPLGSDAVGGEVSIAGAGAATVVSGSAVPPAGSLAEPADDLEMVKVQPQILDLPGAATVSPTGLGTLAGPGTLAGEPMPEGSAEGSAGGSLDEVARELDQAFPSGDAPAGAPVSDAPADDFSGPRGPRSVKKPPRAPGAGPAPAAAPEEEQIDILDHMPPRGSPGVGPRAAGPPRETRPNLRASFPGYRPQADEATAYTVVVDRAAAGRLSPEARAALGEIIANARRASSEEGRRLASSPNPIVAANVSKDHAERMMEALRFKGIPGRVVRRGE